MRAGRVQVHVLKSKFIQQHSQHDVYPFESLPLRNTRMLSHDTQRKWIGSLRLKCPIVRPLIFITALDANDIPISLCPSIIAVLVPRFCIHKIDTVLTQSVLGTDIRQLVRLVTVISPSLSARGHQWELLACSMTDGWRNWEINTNDVHSVAIWWRDRLLASSLAVVIRKSRRSHSPVRLPDGLRSCGMTSSVGRASSNGQWGRGLRWDRLKLFQQSVVLPPVSHCSPLVDRNPN